LEEVRDYCNNFLADTSGGKGKENDRGDKHAPGQFDKYKENQGEVSQLYPIEC